jgi:hypothetical protein
MPSDFAHCRKDRQMPTNTCPHCGTVCGSHIADEGHVLQSKECQRRELAALVNRVEQLTEHLAQKDAEAIELRLNDRIASLEAQLADARELLRECCQGFCPLCGFLHPSDADGECRLAAFLKEADDET